MVAIVFVGCEQPKQPTTKATKDIKNPHNLDNKEKLSAVVNYIVKKKLHVEKPSYPAKPTKPKAKQADSLVKGKFEKTITFEKRVEQARAEREEYVKSLEESYKQKVLAYNKEVKHITDNYNKKISSLKNNIDSITAEAMREAYGTVYGKPSLSATDYDADNEMLYAKLTSSRGDFSKKVAIKVPVDKAEKFYSAIENITPKVIYEYKNNQIYLKDIKIPYKKQNYTALLSDGEYKSDSTEVAINTRELKLVKADMLNSTFKADKRAFDLGKIEYAKSRVARISTKDLAEINRQRLADINEKVDDLPELLQKSTKVKVNQKAYAVIFGIEDYLLESNVAYSQNSALMFAQYANKLLGVPDDNIWAFIGGRKTGAGFIKSQWDDFLSLVESGATIYFYYSGHGVPGDDGNAYILPSDTTAEIATKDKTFMLKNIYKDLSDSKAKRVVAFIDSCFSGKDDKGELLFDGVAPVLKVKRTSFDSLKMTLFTAGSSKNFSNQYAKKKQRLFSYFLMKGMANGKTDTKELYTYMKRNVANKSRQLGSASKQIPELLGQTSGSIR